MNQVSDKEKIKKTIRKFYKNLLNRYADSVGTREKLKKYLMENGLL